MARLNLFDLSDGNLTPPMLGMYYEPSRSEYEVVACSQEVELTRQADGILRDLRQRVDPRKLHGYLIHLGALFPYDHVRKYLEENHVHLSVLAVIQNMPSCLSIQQTGLKLLSLFASESTMLRKSMANLEVYIILLRILTENKSDPTIQESGMNILVHILASDVLQKQLSREEKASVLEVTVNSVIAFQDNSVVLLAALATLNSLLKTDCVQDVFVEQHIAVVMEILDSNRDKPKIVLKILNILYNVAVNDSLRKELIDNGIHIKVFSYIQQADEHTLAPCLDILLALHEHDPTTMSNIVEHLVTEYLVPWLLTHSKSEDIQISGLKIFFVAAGPVLLNIYTSAETALGWLKVVYDAMHKHMDSPDIQMIACQCLSRILLCKPDSSKLIGDGANYKVDPLHTMCLGAILIYTKDAGVFTAATDALYHLAADNDRLCKDLMEKNAHIALIGGLKYHLRRYCHVVSVEDFTSAIASGCRALRGLVIFHDDHKMSVSEQEEIPGLLGLILKECLDEEIIWCETISTLACLADIDTIQHLCFVEGVHYQVIEAFACFPDNAILQEASIEALAVLGGAVSGPMMLNDAGATCLILQVLRKFPENINIQKKGLIALQILAETRLVETKTLCEDLTNAISSVMTSYRSTVSIQREAVVAMIILAEKGHLMSEVLVERGCHEILFEVLENYNDNQGLHDLASECLYVIGCVQNLKSRMLLSACDKGYLAGVECLLEIGADINIGQRQTTPLYFAVKNKDDSLVKCLLQQEVRNLQPALEVSLKQATHAITGMLLSKIGQDKQGGAVLWGGYDLGDLQPEWFVQALTSQTTSHSTSRAGQHLLEKLMKGGEKRKFRISHSPSDSELELSKHCNFRFKRSSSDSSFKTRYSQEKQRRSIRNSNGKSRKVIRNQKTRALKVYYNGKTSPDSEVPPVHCTASCDYLEPKSAENQTDVEVFPDSVFDHTLDEWEEWRRNTLTGANIPFSPSDPRRLQSGTGYHHDNSPKQSWLRKYSLQCSTNDHEVFSPSVSVTQSQPVPAHSAPCTLSPTNTSASPTESVTLSSPDLSLSTEYRFTSSCNKGSISSDTEFEFSQDSITSSTRSFHSPPPLQSQHSVLLMTYLDVSANQIVSLDCLANAGPSFLQLFSGLEKLDLHSNNLQSLPVGIFEYLPKLQNLILSENHLAAFPLEVMVCPMLSSLDISCNQISHMGKLDLCPTSHTLRKLILDSNAVGQFPSDLNAMMPDLEYLSLAKNGLKSLEGCSMKLPELRTLILSHNEIESIPDCFLSACPKLETLEALNNKLTCLPSEDVSKCLPRLYSLKLSTNSLSGKAPFYIPKFVLELQSLRTVDLSDNHLDGLPPPAMWTSQILKHILVSKNNISKLNLDGVKSWSKVEKFHIKANKLAELPKDIGHMVSLESLDISDNKPLTTLPDELGRCSKIWEMPLDGLNLDLNNRLLKGNKTDLIMYLHNRLKKAHPYYRIKLMVIGFGGRGKSTLLQALRQPKQQQRTEQTVGVIVEDWKYERSHAGKTVLYTVSTWDFAGQEEFYSTHQCFLSNRAVYLVVYDITKGPGEIDLLKRWLSNIFSRAPGCPVIVVGTHYDQLAPEMCVEYVPQINEKLYDLQQKSGFPEIKWSTEVDCTCENPELKKLRSVVKKIIDDYHIKGQPVMGQKTPASYIRLAELLSKEAKRQIYPVITHEQLKQMVKDEKLDLEDEEELHQAVQFLHEGGVLLHYNETALMLRNYYFIDPGWLCQMMAKIVTIPMINPFITADGIMEKDVVKLLFEGNTFPLKLIDQYLRLLEKFEIALPRNDSQLLVPCRLPLKRPAFHVPTHEQIHRFYSMPYAPLGFWSRLITRLVVFSHSNITETWLSLNREPLVKYWREGIFVQWSETAFFLVDNKTNTDSEELHIMVPATRPGYQLLGFLVDHLDALIDEWYPGLATLDPLKGRELLDKYVPCVRCDNSNPHLFQFQDLLNQTDQKTNDEIWCPVHQGHVQLGDLAPDIMLLDLEDKFRLDVKELEFHASPENLLGDGGFGSVYRAIYKNQVVAAKVFSPIGDVHPHKLLRQEATVLRRLQHPSVISLLAVGVQPCRIIILEFASLRTLTEILNSEKNLSKVLQHRIALQIAEGLQYLHELMIVFRDLKPDNILMFSLSPSDLINAKISDYGISQFTTLYGLTAQEGTPAYRAPEVIRREIYSFQADVFAFGILLYILLTGGSHPHEELKTRSDMDRAFAENSPIRLITQRGKVPWPDMHDLVMQCLRQVPDDRPKTNDIVERLRSAELFSLKQWFPISVGTTVECMAYQLCDNGLTKVWLASGNNEHMELSLLTLTHHCACVNLQHTLQTAWNTPINPVGCSLGQGRILSILSVDNEHILLGTQMRKISVFDTGKFTVIHSTKLLPDAVISLHLLHRSDDHLVLAGLANGVLAFYTLSELLQKPDHYPLSLNLGKKHEPIRCMVDTKNKVLASCGSRVFVINTRQGLAIESVFDTNDDSDVQLVAPICAMAAGRHAFLSHIRSPMLQVWDTNTQRKHDHRDIAQLFGFEQNEARITAILLHENRALWVGTGGGHIVILEPATLVPVIVASRHTSTVRGLMCITPACRTSTPVVLSCGLGFRSGPVNMKGSQYGCVAVWDADYPQLVKSFKEDVKKRQELANRAA